MPRFTMVLTEKGAAVAHIGKSQTAVEKLSAELESLRVLFGT